MEPLVVCDTNIFIEFYKNNIEICEELKAIGQKGIALSSVTEAELIYGAFNKNELIHIQKDLSVLTHLPITVAISNRAIKLLTKYSLSHRLNLPDALIAATVLEADLPLFTLNRKDFQYIPDLKMWR
ncbi:MAG: type II toxin-antitoxin system VapC family toxin [Bacteroidia bacterium]